MTKSAYGAIGAAIACTRCLYAPPTKTGRQVKQALKIMKLSFLLLFAVFITGHATGVAQHVTIKGENLHLKQVFMAIEKQTGYVVFSKKAMLDNTRPVTVNAQNVPLKTLLDQVLKNQSLKYVIYDKTITLSKKEAEQPPVLQTVEEVPVVIAKPPVRIKVVDTAGNAIAGVTIALKKSRVLGATDANGVFTADVTKGDVLVFSSIGFQTFETTVSDNASMNIVLKAAVARMDDVEITVNTGYQALPKERATGSFGFVSEKELQNKITGNIIDRLEGMVSGLRVGINQTDATLISNRSSFAIRSQNTIRANTQPLIVVDGFPTDFDLNYLNSDDVASITVLKDAAASSIWGARAANGVIVIQTKKGKINNKWQVNFSSDVTVTEKPRLGYLPVMNSASYVDFEKELVTQNRIPDPTNASATASTYPLTAVMDILFQQKNNKITAAQADAMLAEISGRDFKSQYSKYLLQNPVLQQYGLSLSGGNSNASTYISGAFAKEIPNAKGNSATRITVKMSETVRFLKAFTFSGDIQISSFNIQNNGLGLSPLTPGTTTFLPYDQVVDNAGNAVNYSRAFYSGTLDRMEAAGYLNWRYNYLDELNNADNSSRNNLYRTSASLKADIFKGLSASISGVWEKQFLYNRNYNNEATYNARNQVNRTTSINTTTKALIFGYPRGGILREEQSNGENYSVRGQLDYNAQLKQHDINALAGMEMRETFSKGFSNTRYGYSDRDLTSLPVPYGTIVKQAVTGSNLTLVDPATNTWNQNRFMSSFANVGYSYNRRYFLSASARLDDANLFGASEKYRATPLWSVGAAWALSSESWFIQTNWIDKVKLRATYGINGNVDFSTSPYLIATISPTVNPDINQTFSRITNPANPLLRWEKTKTLNLAVDFSLFNDIINGSVDWYAKKNYDLLGPAVINPTLGFSSAIINTADMRGNGLDVSLNLNMFTRKDFDWNMGVNYSFNKTRIVKTDLELKTVNYYLGTGSGSPIVGQPVDRLYSYQYRGLDTTGQPLILNDKGELITVKQAVSVKDALIYSGRTTPPHFGGWNNYFRYKGLSFSALITYQLGSVFRRPSIGEYSSYITQKVIHKDAAQRWRKKGDELTTMVPGMPGAGVTANGARYLNSDYLIESGSFARLREVVLGYDISLPQQLTKVIKSVRINLQARNLAIWTKNKAGIDPEFIPNSSSVILPPAKSFALGLKVQF